MKKIAIYGAGGLGREIALLIKEINEESPEWHLVGFYDDNKPMHSVIDGQPVIGSMAELNAVNEPLSIVLAIGNPTLKHQLFSSINSHHIHYPVLCHPSLTIKEYQQIKIGVGSILTKGVQLTLNISIGNHVLVSQQTTIGHDAVIDDFTSLMPGCRISGETFIGKRCYLGANAVLLNQRSIANNCVIGAGAVVTKSLPTGVTAVGVPARILQKHE